MRSFCTASAAVLAAAVALVLVPAAASAQGRLPLRTSGGYEFPILFESTGGLLDVGFPDNFENAYELSVDGTKYDLFEEGIEADPLLLFEARLVVMPPQIIGDFQVTREIYVPEEGGNWARWKDTFRNLATAPRDVDVQMGGQFACCGAIVDSSDGDAGFQETDFWFTVDDTELFDDPVRGVLVAGADSSLGNPPIANSNRISSRVIYSYAWQRVAVRADGEAVFLTYGTQEDDRDIAADDIAELSDPTTDDTAMFDLEPIIDDVRNFDLRGYRAGGTIRNTPEVRWNADRVADEGEPLNIGVNITDPNESNPPTWSWDLDGDGVFGEEPGVDVIAIPAGTTDGPDAFSVTVQAKIGEGTDDEASSTRTFRVSIQNVAPTITSDPPLTAVLGAAYEYRITVEDPGGVNDECSFSVPEGPEGVTIETLGPQEALLTWRPGNNDVTGPGESILFQLLVDDGDFGQATQTWELRVEDNRSPEAPIPVFPVSEIGLDDPQPRLAVANAEDPDFDDNLVYFFEIDTVDTFEGVNLRRSGPVAELPGFTFWIVEPELEVGKYFWRARASDGSLDSNWVEAEFWVVPEPVDGGPPPIDAGVPVSSDDGGNCAVSDTAPLGPLPLFGLVGLGLALGLRRRRRR